MKSVNSLSDHFDSRNITLCCSAQVLNLHSQSCWRSRGRITKMLIAALRRSWAAVRFTMSADYRKYWGAWHTESQLRILQCLRRSDLLPGGKDAYYVWITTSDIERIGRTLTFLHSWVYALPLKAIAKSYCSSCSQWTRTSKVSVILIKVAWVIVARLFPTSTVSRVRDYSRSWSCNRHTLVHILCIILPVGCQFTDFSSLESKKCLLSRGYIKWPISHLLLYLKLLMVHPAYTVPFDVFALSKDLTLASALQCRNHPPLLQR